MKKILFIPTQYLPIPAAKGGAVEVLLTQLIEENEKHHKADFFVLSKNDEEAKKTKYKYTDISYFEETFASKISFYVVKFLRKLIFNRFTKHIFKDNGYRFQELTYFGYCCDKLAKQIKPDIIVSESYDKIHQLWPLVKRFGNSDFYYHLHYPKEEVHDVRMIFSNTIAISNFVLEHWTKDKNIIGKNRVLYNGIDLARFNKFITNSEKADLKSSYGFGAKDFIVLYTGRLRPQKGIIQLLEGFNKIDNNHVKLLLVGGFLSETKEHGGDERDFEKKCIDIINSNNNIIRLGEVAYDEIADLYHISDIQIIPSMWEEGAGLVAIEGMASGLPLIITNSGGMPEYTGNECAIILERDSKLVENITNSILTLYNNQNLREQMAKKGQERSKLFSKEIYYQKYMNILLNEDNKNGK